MLHFARFLTHILVGAHLQQLFSVALHLVFKFLDPLVFAALGNDRLLLVSSLQLCPQLLNLLLQGHQQEGFLLVLLGGLGNRGQLLVVVGRVLGLLQELVLLEEVFHRAFFSLQFRVVHFYPRL